MGIRKNCVAVNKGKPFVTICGPLCTPPLPPVEKVPTDQDAPTCGPFPRDEKRSRIKAGGRLCVQPHRPAERVGAFQ